MYLSEMNVIFITKPDKDDLRKKTRRPVPLVNVDPRILNKVFANRVLQQHITKTCLHDQIIFILGTEE